MSVSWEHFAGNTEGFAVRVRLQPDPHGGQAEDPLYSHSWGAIELWVENQNVCAHIDQGETLQGAHWYLLPLLQWLAEAWDPLFHEERLPLENKADSAAAELALTRVPPPTASDAEELLWEQEWFDWWARHAVRAGREGGLLPNVVFRRLRDTVELSWDSRQLPGTSHGFRFLTPEGVARLAPEDVAEPLYAAAVATIQELDRRHPDCQEYQDLVTAYAEISEVGRREARVAWLAGLGRALGDAQARWRELVRDLSVAGQAARDAALELTEAPVVVTGSCHATLLFGAVAPSISERDVKALANLLLSQYDPTGDPKPLAELVENVPAETWAQPWEQGYSLAEELHDRLKPDFADELGLQQGWVDIQGLVRQLGIEVTSVQLDDDQIRGVAIAGPQHRPTIASNQRSLFGDSPAAFRFTLAHELCHLLHDRARGRKLGMASGPWAPRAIERRANAFAAYFLMPHHLVQRAVTSITTELATIETVDSLSATLRVSRRAVVEHLFNLNLLSLSDRDRLRVALGYW